MVHSGPLPRFAVILITRDTEYHIMDENLNRGAVAEEVVAILSQENIISALKNAAGGSPEKDIAAEFVNSYLDFIKEVVGHDIERGSLRADFEIRDLVAHVNSMMQQKDEYIYTTMVTRCPLHYRNVHENLTRQPEG